MLLYDIDDLLFAAADSTGDQHATSSSGSILDLTPGSPSAALNPYRLAMEACDGVITSTEYLKNAADIFLPNVQVIKNGLSREFLRYAAAVPQSRSTQARDETCIAYLSGSAHHDRDFLVVQSALLKILEDFPASRLLIAGKLKAPSAFARFGNRCEVRPFMPYRDFWTTLGEVDINIVPLNLDDPFAQARSEIKYTEAGAYGVPTVASPTQAYREAIRQGENGFLAADKEQWYHQLSMLVCKPELRKALGEAARRDVLANYGPEARADQWHALMSEFCGGGSASAKVLSARAGWAYLNLARTVLWRTLRSSERLVQLDVRRRASQSSASP